MQVEILSLLHGDVTLIGRRIACDSIVCQFKSDASHLKWGYGGMADTVALDPTI